jgi:hypothetical protein
MAPDPYICTPKDRGCVGIRQVDQTFNIVAQYPLYNSNRSYTLDQEESAFTSLLFCKCPLNDEYFMLTAYADMERKLNMSAKSSPVPQFTQPRSWSLPLPSVTY